MKRRRAERRRTVCGAATKLGVFGWVVGEPVVSPMEQQVPEPTPPMEQQVPEPTPLGRPRSPPEADRTEAAGRASQTAQS